MKLGIFGFMMGALLLASGCAQCAKNDGAAERDPSVLYVAGPEKVPEGGSSELLATGEMLAEYKGTSEMKCVFMTSECPDRCDHGGTFANFKRLAMLTYRRPSAQYGDGPLMREYLVRLEKAGKPDADLDPTLADVLKQLKVGDTVKLTWEHRYVDNGKGLSTPVRRVVELDKGPKIDAIRKQLEEPAK